MNFEIFDFIWTFALSFFLSKFACVYFIPNNSWKEEMKIQNVAVTTIAVIIPIMIFNLIFK